jgi:hypothetical protein
MATARSFVLVSLVLTTVFVGTATAQEATQITNADELDDVREDLGGEYVLADDVDLSEDPSFEPIGDGDEAFTGRFDGGGNVITGLSVVRPGEDYVGLFGAVGSDGVVTQVGLEGVEVEGGERVGGVAGSSRGNVTDTYVDGTVSGEDDYVGGLVGWNRGFVERSYSLAGVTGRLDVGGVAGRTDGGGTVAGTYAAGRVSATEGRVGGLVGTVGSRNQLAGRESVLRDSYWDTTVTGQTEAYGERRAGEGEVAVENVEGLTTDEMQGTDADERMTAFDFVGTWDTTEEYPVFTRQTGIVPGQDAPLPGFGVFAAVLAVAVAAVLRARASSDR